MPSQLTARPSDIPLNNLYNLLEPITVPQGKATFTNWGQTFICSPSSIFEPENEFQCELALELARREGKTLRVVGVGHSPSDLACTNEFMLRMTKLNRVLEVGLYCTYFYRGSSFLFLFYFFLAGQHRETICRRPGGHHPQ